MLQIGNEENTNSFVADTLKLILSRFDKQNATNKMIFGRLNIGD